MEKELLDLRAQVSQQEQLLQSTAARLKKANQRKKSMEQFIVSHCRSLEDTQGQGRALPDTQSRGR